MHTSDSLSQLYHSQDQDQTSPLLRKTDPLAVETVHRKLKIAIISLICLLLIAISSIVIGTVLGYQHGLKVSQEGSFPDPHDCSYS